MEKQESLYFDIKRTKEGDEPLSVYATKLGGLPSFTQEDPRSYGEPEYEVCDVLLFQLDSYGGVMYYWDCS